MSGWFGSLENQKLGWDASRTHGKHGTPAHQSWNGMLQRCLNPKNKRWNSYGGSGVTVCERWLKFDNFFADMGERPKGKSIDRYPDPFGNYEPENCRWATPQEQQNNMRNHNFLTFRGKTQIISDWAKELDIGLTTIITRLRRGWSIERALSKSSQDTRNSKNKSGFPGVYRYPYGDKWAAQLKINGRMVALGRGDTPLEAYMLRVNSAKENGVSLPEGDWFDKRDHDTSTPMHL